MKIRDSETAFENAIEQGLVNPEAWMYMYSDDDMDYFKNIDTREYVKYPYKNNEEE